METQMRLRKDMHEAVNLIRSEETVDPIVDPYDTAETIYDLLLFRITLLSDFQRSSTIEYLARGLYLVHELYTEIARSAANRN